MIVRHSKLFAASTALLLSLASAAGAMVLWDQSNWNLVGEGSLNMYATSCSPITGNTKQHTACDVHFSTPVHLTSVTIYESDGNVFGASQAFLWIAPKTSAMPTNSTTELTAAANNTAITTSVVTNGDAFAIAVTASGLSIDLPAGDYWVSLTPKHSIGFFPYSVHLVTDGAVVGDPTPSLNSCTTNNSWFYFLAPNLYDYAIKIEGDAAVPTHASSWGRIKTMYR